MTVLRHIFRHRINGMAAKASRVDLQNQNNEPWQFDFTGFKATAYMIDGVDVRDGVKLHTGLEITTVIDSEDDSEVPRIVESVLEQLLNIVSLVTVASCDFAEVISHIAIADSGVADAQFYTYLFSRDPIIIGTPRKIKPNSLKQAWDALDKSEHKNRLMRSLSWFRKGLAEDKNLDKFISFWVGIEVIKSILRREMRKTVKNPKIWDGVKASFQQAGGKFNFDEIYELRNELLHGYQEITPALISKITNSVDTTRTTLLLSICKVLALPDSLTNEIISISPRRSLNNLRFETGGTLTGLPLQLSELLTNPPRMEGNVSVSRYRFEPDGRLLYDLGHQLTARLPRGTVFNATSGSVRGHGEAGIDEVKLTQDFH